MKKYFLTIIVIASMIALVATYRIQQSTIPTEVVPLSHIATSTAPAASVPAASPTIITTPAVSKPAPTTNPTTSSVATGSSIPLFVDGKRYDAPFRANSTVLDTMRALASTTDFTFTSKDYPSLGAFVESINGTKNADGYYWILYINSKDSPTGASQTFLKPTDTIEWRYKKGY